MTKAMIIWPYNLLSLISNQSRKNQMRLISDRFENFLWSRRTKSPHFIMCSLVINLKSADFKIFLKTVNHKGKEIRNLENKSESVVTGDST